MQSHKGRSWTSEGKEFDVEYTQGKGGWKRGVFGGWSLCKGGKGAHLF